MLTLSSISNCVGRLALDTSYIVTSGTNSSNSIETVQALYVSNCRIGASHVDSPGNTS